MADAEEQRALRRGEEIGDGGGILRVVLWGGVWVQVAAGGGSFHVLIGSVGVCGERERVSGGGGGGGGWIGGRWGVIGWTLGGK